MPILGMLVVLQEKLISMLARFVHSLMCEFTQFMMQSPVVLLVNSVLFLYIVVEWQCQ
jgi:hypothetical protein